jgi:TonB-dependent starch-binding outer membrane protein SusC
METNQNYCFFFLKKLSKLLIISKFALLLFLFTVPQVTAEVFSQNGMLTINESNITVRQLFQKIETKTDIAFLYNDRFTDLDAFVNANYQNTSLSDLLADVLKNTSLNYQVLENNMVVLVPKSNIEDFRVTGTITGENGQTLPGATVVEKGTTTGTVTSVNGVYEITVSGPQATLVISFMGYITQEVALAGRSVVNVELEADLTELTEVVVIGYGTRSSRDVTTSISSITSDAISQSISMTAETAMQGRMAGVQVTNPGGNPLARPQVRIRGVNTWGISNPLYVIDGVPVTEFGAGYEGLEDARATDVRGPLNIMATIDPNDIESISVLKDASAAAIYGVRAANGVILITTKRGRVGRPQVEFSSRYGRQTITQELDVLNTAQYTAHIQRVHASDPTLEISPENEGRFDPADPRYLGNSPTYNWQEALKNNGAPTQDYSLRISGATDRTDYFVSGSFSETQGALVHNELQRYSGSFKINTQINDWIKAGVNYRISQAEGRDNSFRINFWEYAMFPPWQRIYDESGPGGFAPTVEGVLPDGSYSSTKLFGQGTRLHSIASFALNEQRYETNRSLGNVYFELEPVKNLTVRAQVSMDNYQTIRYQFNDHRTSVFDYTRGDPRQIGGGSSVGTYEERNVYNNNMIKEIFINYVTSINGHNLDLLFSGMDQQYNSKYVGASTQYMTTTRDYLRRLGGENQYTSLGSDLTRHSLQGLLGRIGYNYQFTYYLDLVLRRDGSARFAPENRWGTFPAVSAAWRISNEAFMSDLDWLDDLKLRAGWGQLGNQEVRNMAYLSAIATNPTFAWGNTPDGLGNFSSAATVFAMANRDLQWERTATTNIGFDALLFGGLLFTAEYYDKNTEGILQTVALPNSVGVTQQPVDNVASVRNRGFEVALNYQGQVGDLVYNIGGNFTMNDNEVTSTYKGIPLFGQGIEEGYPLFYLRGYKLGGIFQNQSEIDAWLAQNTDDNYQLAKVGPGDFYFQDLRGAPENEGEFYTEGADGTINQYDQVYLGKSIPGHFYGFNLNLVYRVIDFGAVFTGVGDVVKFNQVRQSLEYTPGTGGNLSVDVLNSWSPENPNSTMPRIMRGDPANNFRASDYFVESAAYLRLSNIQVGYTLPRAFYTFTNDNVSNVRIYLGATNLLTLTPYKGLDPESDKYPLPRVFFMGLNARF